MTSTEKQVIRRTTSDTVFEQGKHRRIVVVLGGGKDPDLIRFRLEGKRNITDGLVLRELFWTDTKRTVQRRWEKTNAERKMLGKRRLKKPKFDHA